jgi:hypothetical protein
MDMSKSVELERSLVLEGIIQEYRGRAMTSQSKPVKQWRIARGWYNLASAQDTERFKSVHKMP